MHSLAILNWDREKDETSVQEVNIAERGDLLPAFMKSTGLFFLSHDACKMPEPSPENYADHLSAGTVLEISGKTDFDKAADACLSFLDQI